MMKLLRNKKGFGLFVAATAIEYVAVGLTVIAVGIGHVQYKAGKWGANGTEAVHYDRAAAWYSQDKP